MTKLTKTGDRKQLALELLEKEKEYTTTVILCGSTGCKASKSWDIIDVFRNELKKHHLDDHVHFRVTGCHGFCEKGPVMVIDPQGIFYCKVTPDDVPEIIEETVKKNQPIERLLYTDPVTKKKVVKEADVPFYSAQHRNLLKYNRLVSPTNIEDYIAIGGYEAAEKALTQMSPEEIIREVTDSEIRGRGGAGFPTGMKWQFCAQAEGDEKFILCNGDEGDPGAFMDRSVLEADPHAVIEGMLIGAKAIGARKGYIYVRAEYILAVERLGKAIEQANEYGLLGENILGTGFHLDLEIYLGAGAFVCGEETALMRSIEGKRGMPSPRPPFPAHKGLFNKPTVLNNVETLSNIPQIIMNSAKWFAKFGVGKSKGTKVFAVSGCINNIGLIEVPMGITLRSVIDDICGGIKGRKRKFKAVQVGGPSGGCLPESLLDTPVDFESITKTGAIMGSGGMVVMDQKSCMVDVARFFLGFTAEESCGKCTPCREGNERILEILTDISEGQGQEGDLELLEGLSQYVKDSSLCGLGQTAPNPVLTTIKYFREEFEAHIRDKKCPAKKCAALVEFKVVEDKCKKCGLCFKACPAKAVIWEKKQVASIDTSKCTKCMSCYGACEFDAID